MKIIYTKHAQQKFVDLKALGVQISRRAVRICLINPIRTDAQPDSLTMIASGLLDDTHVLRVVFRKGGDKMIVITFYPARSERYTS